MSAVALSPRGLVSNVGRCSYSLAPAPTGRLEGQSSCYGVDFRPASLAIPAGIRALPAPEQAAVLAAILSR